MPAFSAVLGISVKTWRESVVVAAKVVVGGVPSLKVIAFPDFSITASLKYTATDVLVRGVPVGEVMAVMAVGGIKSSSAA